MRRSMLSGRLLRIQASSEERRLHTELDARRTAVPCVVASAPLVVVVVGVVVVVVVVVVVQVLDTLGQSRNFQIMSMAAV